MCLLADRVHQMEMRVGKHDGQWDAGETSSRAQIHDVGIGLEMDKHGYAQGMEHMMLVERIYILA